MKKARETIYGGITRRENDPYFERVGLYARGQDYPGERGRKREKGNQCIREKVIVHRKREGKGRRRSVGGKG